MPQKMQRQRPKLRAATSSLEDLFYRIEKAGPCGLAFFFGMAGSDWAGSGWGGCVQLLTLPAKPDQCAA